MATIEKPPDLHGHDLHRVVAALSQGAAWVDTGAQIVYADLEREFATDTILAGTMTACVSKKINGKHRYFHTSDWRSRHEWLHNKGLKHGFEVLSVHCQAQQRRITKGPQPIQVDETRFVFILKVTDPIAFKAAYIKGISSTAKTYGYNFINV